MEKVENSLSILITADMHYSDKPTPSHNRRHGISLTKLREALSDCCDCDMAIDLGDMTDEFEGCSTHAELIDILVREYKTRAIPLCCVIGNHDTEGGAGKSDFVRRTGMPFRYYSFDRSGWRLIFLDTVNPSLSEVGEGAVDWMNMWIDSEQLDWLRGQLDELKNTDTRAVVFAHTVLHQGNLDPVSTAKNGDEAAGIIEESGVVTAVFCGHAHNHDIVKAGDVTYYTVPSLCTGEDNAYVKLTLNPTGFELEGCGRAEALQELP